MTALATVTITSSLVLSAPAQAAPPEWELPDGVTRVGGALFHVDADGKVFHSGPVAPGRTFFAGYRIKNSSNAPVTLTGFEPNFIFTMDPARQGDLPDDYCHQFFKTQSFNNRDGIQAYPQVIEPDVTITFYDNVTYHYIHGPVSNECQNGSLYFGAPTFAVPDTETPPEDVDPPVEEDQTPPEEVDPPVEPTNPPVEEDQTPPVDTDAPSIKAPTPPVQVETAR